MATRITPTGYTVGMVFNEDNDLVITCAGRQAKFNEDEVHELLMTLEWRNKRDPLNVYDDMATMFEDVFPNTAYRVAVQFVDNAVKIGKRIYA